MPEVMRRNRCRPLAAALADDPADRFPRDGDADQSAVGVGHFDSFCTAKVRDTVTVKHGSESPRQGITRAPHRGFWELWSVRFTSVVVLLATVLFVAVVGDPDTESWQAKTGELLYSIVATSLGHRGG